MKISGLWDSIGNNRLCGREDCQHCGNCSGEPIQVLPAVHCTQQVESGNPGESKELRNAREKFNRVFGVSLGEEDRLVRRLGMLELQISYLNQVSYYSCTCWQGRVPAQGYIYLTVTGTSRFILPSIWTLTFCDGSVIHKHLFIQVTHLAFYAFMLGIETKVFFPLNICINMVSCIVNLAIADSVSGRRKK